MIIDSKVLDEEQAHTLLKSCVVPRPIAWVSTIGKAGVANLAPYSCFTFVATKPPMLCFSIGRRKDGGIKDTLTNILETQQFVVHIVSDDYAKAVTSTAAELPPDSSEWDLIPFHPIPADRVTPSRIAESPISLECRFSQSIELGESHHTLVIGEIMLFHIEDSLYKDGEVNVSNLHPLCRLAGDWFGKLGDFLEVKRNDR